MTAHPSTEAAAGEVQQVGRGVQNSFLPPKGELGKETNFRPVKAVYLLAQEPEPVVWVWEPFIPEGALALLAAFMKVGKSTFAYALAVAVAQGRPFLGFPTKQGGVLILAVEEHPRDVKLRLQQRFGMRAGDPLYVHTGPLANDKATLEAIKDFISRNAISLVILDTLGRFWRVKDENSNAEVVQEVSPLLDLARDTGAAVLLVHHESKSGGEDGKGIRGASALFGLVDQAFLLQKAQGGSSNRRVLKCIGRYDETPREVVLELEGDEYRLLGKPEDLDLEMAKGKVLQALSGGPQDTPTLSKLTQLPDSTTRRALTQLGDLVVRDGRGVKGDPHTYRRVSHISFLSQSHPNGEETNPDPPACGLMGAS